MEKLTINKQSFENALRILQQGDSSFNSVLTTTFLKTINGNLYFGYDANDVSLEKRATTLYKLGKMNLEFNCELRSTDAYLLKRAIKEIKLTELILEIEAEWLNFLDTAGGNYFNHKVKILSNKDWHQALFRGCKDKIAELRITKELATELDDSVNSISKDVERDHLHKVAIVKQGENFDFVATDGQAMRILTKKASELNLKVDKISIPLGFCKRIKHLIATEGEAWFTQYGGLYESAFLKTENFMFFIENNKFKFVNYLGALPRVVKNKQIVLNGFDKESLLRFIKINHCLVEDDVVKDYIKICVKDKRAIISAYISHESRSIINIPLKKRAEDTDFYISYKDFLDTLEIFKGEPELVLNYNDEEEPIMASYGDKKVIFSQVCFKKGNKND